MKKLIIGALIALSLTGCAVVPYGGVTVSTPNVAIQGTVDYRLPNPYYVPRRAPIVYGNGGVWYRPGYVPPRGYYRGY